MRHFIATLIALFLAPAAYALCAGPDLKPTLSDTDMAALEAEIAEIPYNQHLIWTAQKDGKTIYVIGTMHVYHPSVKKVFERVVPLIKKSDVIMLEASPEDQKRLKAQIATDPSLVFLTEGPTLPELLSEDEWQTLLKVANERGLPSFIAAKSKPWFLSLTLAVPPCLTADQSIGLFGLDHMIGNAAKQLGLPILSAEPYTTVFSLLDQGTVEDQLDDLHLAIMPLEQAQSMLTTMIARYGEGQHAEAWILNRYLSYDLLDIPRNEIDTLFQDMSDTLLTTRNRNWIPEILKAQEKGTLMVAVGAGHLAGKDGVLNLLAEQGYALTPYLQ